MLSYISDMVDAIERATALVNDQGRVRAVQRTGLSGSPAEEVFDRLTRLAALVTHAPISFFSVVDSDHDLFKSCHGMPEPLATVRRVTGRTFCHMAILQNEPLAVTDARNDPLYRDIATVKDFGVAAYLGMPLFLSTGEPIGSFCVVDFVPREWTATEIDVLREFGKSALREVELRMLMEDQRSNKDRITSQVRDPLTVLHLHMDLLDEAADMAVVKAHLQPMRDGLQRIEGFVARSLQIGRD